VRHTVMRKLSKVSDYVPPSQRPVNQETSAVQCS